MGHSFRKVFGRKCRSFLFLLGSEGYKNVDFYNDKGAEGSGKTVYAYSFKFREKIVDKDAKNIDFLGCSIIYITKSWWNSSSSVLKMMKE